MTLSDYMVRAVLCPVRQAIDVNGDEPEFVFELGVHESTPKPIPTFSAAAPSGRSSPTIKDQKLSTPSNVAASA